MVKDLTKNLVVAIIYLLLALPMMFFGRQEGIAAPFWPASGVALFALMRYGKNILPGIFFGAVASSYGMAMSSDIATSIALSIFSIITGIGNVLEAVIIVKVLGKGNYYSILTNTSKTFRFLGAALIGTLASSILGTFYLPLLEQTSVLNFSFEFSTWWLGNFISIITVVPILLTLKELISVRLSRHQQLELVGYLAAIAVVEFFLKGYLTSAAFYNSLIFVSIPVMLWISSRFPKSIVFLGVFTFWFLSTYSGIKAAPPFNIDSPVLRFLAIQQFQLVLASTILIVTTTIEERKHAFRKLAEGYHSIEQKVKDRTSELENANQLLLQEFSIREAMEAQLTEKEEILKQTQQLARIGSWEYQVNTSTIHWSEETFRILDLPSRKDITQIEDLQLVPGDYRISIFRSLLNQSIINGQSLQELISLKTTSGRHKTVLLKFLPIQQNGVTVRVRGIIQDMTDLLEKERELRESEEKYRFLFSANIDSIVMFDLENLEITETNQSFTDLYGYSKEEIIGKPYTILTAEEEKTALQIRSAIDEGFSRESIRLHRKKNGETIYTETALSSFLVKGRKICYAISHDITQRVKAEQQLSERETRFRSFFESNLVGFAEISISGEWLNFNSKLCEILGSDPGKLMGTTWMEITQRDDVETENNLIHKILTRQIESYSLEKRFIRPDGSLTNTRVWMSPIRTTRGNLRSYIYIVEDINSHKEAENEVLESRKKLEIAQGIGHVGSFTLNLSTKKMEWSDEVFRILGYLPGEFHPTLTSFKRMLFDEDKNAFDILVKELTDEPTRIHKIEKTITRPGGEIRYITITLSTQQQQNGNSMELMGSISDVSDIKSVQVELEKANKTKDKMLSIIAHDVRSPLASVKQIVDMLANEWKIYDPEVITDLLNSLRTSTNDTFNLLENLLGWARSQDKEIVFHPRKNNLVEIINETLLLIKNPAAAKQISVTTKLTPKETALFDLQMVRLVLRNLLSNAVKFTPQKGTITVALSSNQSSVEVTISDSGVGMDQETLKKVFDSQFHYTTLGTMDERGSGLGLKLAYEFISLNGGKLWAESTPEVGTTVHFTLPKETTT